MREAKERQAALDFMRRSPIPDAAAVGCGDGTSLGLGAHCTVLGGRNGAGKSRLLRRVRDESPEDSIYIDLHVLAEQALGVIGARTDAAEMFDEFEPVLLSGDALEDVARIVGRDYDRVEWFSLDVLPSETAVASAFKWGAAGDKEDEPVLPYFRVEYRGRTYGSADMGAGEHSVHVLFWVLEQLRERRDLLILLDEPDALLPPVGVGALLGRLARICAPRRWRLIVASHSEEMIRIAVDANSFVLAELGSDGGTRVVHSRDNDAIWRGLMSPSAIDTIIYCEDESAHHLIRAILKSHDASLLQRTQILWGGGHGYLAGLRKHLPAPRTTRIRHAFVYDGDQRNNTDSDGQPAHFLPTSTDPDSMFREARNAPHALAAALRRDLVDVERVLTRLEGFDPHDWVNELGAEFGRQNTLGVLADLWVEANGELAAVFASELAKQP